MLEEGTTQTITLNWWATDAGEHTVVVAVDPQNLISELDEVNNNYSFTFTISERPVQPVLRFQSGSVTTSPPIPTPGIAFSINIRVHNLGQNDATSLQLSLSYRDAETNKWMEIESCLLYTSDAADE